MRTPILDVSPDVFSLAEYRLSVLVLVNSEAVAAVTDMAVKVPAPTVSPKARPWTTTTEPASVWRAELDGNTNI